MYHAATLTIILFAGKYAANICALYVQKCKSKAALLITALLVSLGMKSLPLVDEIGINTVGMIINVQFRTYSMGICIMGSCLVGV
jgi:hypothetical protein